jgi:hypothetical protein
MKTKTGSGTTVRIKSIAALIVESSPIGTIFKSRNLSLKVQSIIGEKDLYYFYESYDSRPQVSKGETQVEWGMKSLEQSGVVQRIMPKVWQKII